VTADIWDRLVDIDKGFLAMKRFQGISHPGFWIDLDMIPFGQLQMMAPEELGTSDDTAEFSGHGYRRWSSFTQEQMRTFITLRALGASPLFMGGDLPTLDDYSLSLLTHPEMLACNQNGEGSWNTFAEDGVEVWNTPLHSSPFEGWIGVFNRNPSAVEVSLTRNQLGIEHIVEGYKTEAIPGAVRITDVWGGGDSHLPEDSLKLSIRPGDVWFARYRILGVNPA
jgi:alpha-galactosidase